MKLICLLIIQVKGGLTSVSSKRTGEEAQTGAEALEVTARLPASSGRSFRVQTPPGTSYNVVLEAHPVETSRFSNEAGQTRGVILPEADNTRIRRGEVWGIGSFYWGVHVAAGGHKLGRGHR